MSNQTCFVPNLSASKTIIKAILMHEKANKHDKACSLTNLHYSYFNAWNAFFFRKKNPLLIKMEISFDFLRILKTFWNVLCFPRWPPNNGKPLLFSLKQFTSCHSAFFFMRPSSPYIRREFHKKIKIKMIGCFSKYLANVVKEIRKSLSCPNKLGSSSQFPSNSCRRL